MQHSSSTDDPEALKIISDPVPSILMSGDSIKLNIPDFFLSSMDIYSI